MQRTDEEKDLGVYTTSDFKPSTQCNKAANKAMPVLRIVNRSFRGLDKDDFLVIYKTFIRPHLEYCVQSWNPHFSKDEDGESSEKGHKVRKREERQKVFRQTTHLGTDNTEETQNQR